MFRAFERIFAGSAYSPRVSIETTSSAIYKTILATSDRIALLSKLETKTDGGAETLTTLPFDSAILARTDGVATRADWQPTHLHAEFLTSLRRQARDLQQLEQNREGAACIDIS